MPNTAEKYKIWDTETKTWFKPTYPGNKPGKNNTIITTHLTKEILFSQSGDIFMREHSPETGEKYTDLNLIPRYIPCIYTHMKDYTGKKIYANDFLISSGGLIIGLVDFRNGSFVCVYPGHQIDKEPKWDYLCDVIKANAVYYGNILETPEII